MTPSRTYTFQLHDPVQLAEWVDRTTLSHFHCFRYRSSQERYGYTCSGSWFATSDSSAGFSPLRQPGMAAPIAARPAVFRKSRRFVIESSPYVRLHAGVFPPEPTAA